MIGLVMTLLAIYFYGINEKRYLSVFLVLGLSTACFQLLPLSLMILPPLGISKPFDWAYLFCGFILLFHPHVFLQRSIWLRYKWIIAYTLLLFFLLYYSTKYAKVETSVSIRVFRGHFYLILLFPFSLLSKNDFLKAFRLVVYVVTASSFLYCLQPVVNTSLLNATTNPEPEFRVEGGILRFYNLPGLVFPVIFIAFFPKSTFNIQYKHLLSIINFGAVVISQNRSMLMVFILCFMMHQIITGKMKPATVVIYALLGLITYTLVDAVLGSRFSDGFKELGQSSLSFTAAKVYTRDVPNMSTSEFRWYHVVERTEYILEDKWRSMFGIGLITEDSKAAAKLNFAIGNADDAGDVPQVSTGDIVWSVLFLQMGLFGTSIFVLMYISFMRRFVIHRKSDMLKIAFYYTLFLLLTSLYSISIIQPHNLCMLAFFIAYLYHHERSIPVLKRVEKRLAIAIA